MQNPINFIAESNLTRWTVDVPDETTGIWSRDPVTKTITFSPKVTSDKLGAGAKLLFQDSIAQAYNMIVLDLEPGTSYKAGIVFNYLDDSNYLLYYLNQFSAGYNAYRPTIVSVQNGVAALLYDSKVDVKWSGHLTLLIEQVNGGLVFGMAGGPIFRMESVTFKPNTSCGLFSQQNDTAIFQSLLLTSEVIASESSAPPPMTSLEKKKTEQVDRFQGYLEIQPPAAETQIEFQELFTVALDSFYVSMFLNARLDPNLNENKPGFSNVWSVKKKGDIIRTYNFKPDSGSELFRIGKGTYLSVHMAPKVLPAGGCNMYGWNKDTTEPVWTDPSVFFKDYIALTIKSPDRQKQIDFLFSTQMLQWRTGVNPSVIGSGAPGTEVAGVAARTILSNTSRAYYSLSDYTFTVRRNSDDVVVCSKTFSPRLLRLISFSPDDLHVLAYQYVFNQDGDRLDEARPAQLVTIRTSDGKLTVLGDTTTAGVPLPGFLSSGIVVDRSRAAAVYDLTNQLLQVSYNATHADPMRLSADAQRIIFIAADKKAICYRNVSSGNQPTTLPAEFEIKGFEVVSDQKIFLVSEMMGVGNHDGCRAGFMDLGTGVFTPLTLPVDSVNESYQPRGTGISVDRKKVALVLTRCVYIIDAQTSTITNTIDNRRTTQGHTEHVNTSVRFTADGTRILGEKFRNHRVIASGNWLVDEIPAGFSVSVISEDGSTAMLTRDGGDEVEVKFWNVTTRTEITGPTGGVTGRPVALSPDGKIRLYEKTRFSANCSQRDLPMLMEEGFQFRFSPDSSTVIFLDPVKQANDKYRVASYQISGGFFGGVTITSIQTKRQAFDWLPSGQGITVTGVEQFELYSPTYTLVRAFPFDTSSSRVNAFCFSDDSKFCAAVVIDYGGQCTKIMVWNIQTGARVYMNLLEQNQTPEFIALNIDGSLLAIQPEQTKVTVVALPSGETITDITVDEQVRGCIFHGKGETATFFFKLCARTYHTLDPEKVTAPPMGRTFSYRLDYRPKTWYRSYQLARNEEKFFNEVQVQYNGIVNALKGKMVVTNGATPTAGTSTTGTASTSTPPDPHEIIVDSIKKMDAYRKQMGITQARIFEYRDVRQKVLHDIRTNDYALAEVNSNGTFVIRNAANETIAATVGAELRSLGFDIAIIEGKPSFENFKPFPIEGGINFNSDTEWAVFEGNFKNYLFVTLTEAKQGIYNARVAELKKKDSSNEFKAQKRALEDEADQADKKIDGFEAQIISNTAAKDEWAADLLAIRTIAGQLDNGANVIDEFLRIYGRLKNQAFKKLLLYFDQSTFNTSETKSITLGHWPFRQTVSWVVTTEHHQYSILHHYQPSAKDKLLFSHRQNWVSGLVTDNSLQDLVFFLAELGNICSRQITKLEGSNQELTVDIQVQNQSIKHATDAKDNLEQFGMGLLRKKFIEYWNDPDEFGALKMLANPVRPESDPLADLLEELRREYSATADSDAPEIFTDVFRFQGNQYLNGDGLTIPAYLNYVQSTGEQRLAIFPQFRDNGEQDPNLLRAVIHPRRANANFLRLPKIKFVETYLIQVSWKGYRLGELSHSENLFPAQSKEITLERSTVLTQRTQQDRVTSQVISEKLTSSFEENLTKEFSEKNTSEASNESEFETNDKTTSDESEDNTQTNTKNFNITANLTLGGVVKKLLGGGTVTSGYTDNSQSTRQSTKKNSYELSNKRSGKVASKESKESFAKEVMNTINKISSETSRENKVEVKVSTTEEYTETQTWRETVRLENPNGNRTVNYNFFQVQNAYEVRTVLTDVKIVVDPNQEYIKGSGINDARVYELEELGKIISGMDEDDPIQVLTAAIIARQAFKNYLGTGIPGVARGNGALEIEQPFVPDAGKFRTLFFSDEGIESGENSYITDLVIRLREALNYLKKTPFVFRQVPLQEPKTYSINAGAYYLDSETGKRTVLENDGIAENGSGNTSSVFAEPDLNDSV